MYQTAFGIIETLAPLHVGASAGEETGNLNLIFRDQFTQTGIIPGSSIRGRFRADMRGKRQAWLEAKLAEQGIEIPDLYIQEISVQENGKTKQVSRLQWLEMQAKPYQWQIPIEQNEQVWYGHETIEGRADGGTTEALVKFEYASLLWLPVFCPGQPVVWVSSRRLLERYKLINPNITDPVPSAYTAAKTLQGKTIPGTEGQPDRKLLFFNLGYIEIPNLVEESEIELWIPSGSRLKAKNLVIVDDNDIAMIHDMALFRQTRVKLGDTEKKVAGGAFFNVEALPEGSYLVFPIALKTKDWKPFSTVEEFQPQLTPDQRESSEQEAVEKSETQPDVQAVAEKNMSGEDADNENQENSISKASDEPGNAEQHGTPLLRKTQDLYFGGLESIGFGHCRVTLEGL